MQGDPEYRERYQKMVDRFKLKLASTAAAAPAAASQPPVAPADSLSGDARAEACKEEGNKLLQAKKYDQAVEQYTLAIQCSPNGPKSHVYFANRAAAR